MTGFPEQAPCPRCSRSALTQRGWKAFKMLARFLTGNNYNYSWGWGMSWWEREHWLQLIYVYRKSFMIDLGAQEHCWDRLTYMKRLSRVVFCSKNWLRAAAPVLSLSLPVPQKTTTCLHPVPLNMANKALWRVLWLESQQVDVILMPVLQLAYRTGLQIGISPH